MVGRDGCDPRTVVFILGDAPSHLEGLETGNLDAAALLDPYTARALRTDYRIIANLDNELCPDYGRCPISIVAADSDWAAANDEVLARFVKALEAAMLWIRTNELLYRAELVTCCALTADDAADVRVPNFVGERRHLPSDMLRLVDILIAHDLRDLEIQRLRFGSTTLPVVGLDALIAMKKAAGRPQDLEDVRALEKLQ